MYSKNVLPNFMKSSLLRCFVLIHAILWATISLLKLLKLFMKQMLEGYNWTFGTTEKLNTKDLQFK